MTTLDVTGAGGARPPALLHAALDQLRLEGAIFFRSELTEGFAFESTPAALADALHPGAERVILFHIVARGTCWVAVDDGVRHRANEGDVIVLPYGDRHTIGGYAPAESVLDPHVARSTPVGATCRRSATAGAAPGSTWSAATCTRTIRSSTRRCRALPPAFVVPLPDGATAGWVQASIAYALEETTPSNLSPNPITTRLPELVLIEVLRLHLATAPAADHGWIAALRDPVLAPALSLLHGDPDRRWTVADLAAGAAVSRSLLDERFRQVLGRSPIRYLTEWRMHLAEELLATTDLGVAVVARRVGYDSEEAFSRAFKRAHGSAPSHWRAARVAQTGSV